MPAPLSLGWSTAIASLQIPLSIVGMALCGALLAHFGDNFPAWELGAQTRQLMFATTFATVFGMVVLAGNWTTRHDGPRTRFGLTTNFAFQFLVFLQFIVGAACITSDLQDYGCTLRCETFRTLEGVSWTITWLAFFQMLLCAKVAWSDPPPVPGFKSVDGEMGAINGNGRINGVNGY